MARLVLDDCSKRFGDKTILENVTFSFEDAIYYITGENGSGKSTLLKMMMGLILPDTGTITLFGENSKNLSNACKKQIGYMFASERTLYYKLTARENLEMIGSIYKLRRKALKNRVGEVLDTVGLDDDKTFIESYSTGMKKRLMLARAILYDPQIFLLDEPYSGLDPEGCKLLSTIINEEGKRGKTVILVSHQVEHVSTHWNHLKVEEKHLCTG